MQEILKPNRKFVTTKLVNIIPRIVLQEFRACSTLRGHLSYQLAVPRVRKGCAVILLRQGTTITNFELIKSER